MADSSSEAEKTDISVRLPVAFVDELMDQHPAATSAPDAIRSALEQHVRRNSKLVSSAEVHDSVVEALEREGGRIENIQRIQLVDSGGETTADETAEVHVEDE
jgi:hypothetical protein